jgi:multisubunit Na+/H+ antiporter MnhE subunit
LKLPSFPDPIVLGVAEDNRMFMVAWWDIKRDIDRVKENIKVFKKFKVV